MMLRNIGTLTPGDSLGVPWVFEPGGPVSIPLYHTRPIQHGLHGQPNRSGPKQNKGQGRGGLTFATTAKTMGPKIMFMSMLLICRSVTR